MISRFTHMTRLVGYFCSMAWVLATLIFINRLSAMVKLFMALYLRQELGFSIETVGWLLSGYGAGLLIGSMVGGLLSDHFSTTRLTAALFFVSAWILVLLGLVTDVTLLGGLLLLSGALDGAIRTLHQRLLMEHCEVKQRARAQSLSRVASNLGMAVAGVAGGVLAQTDFRWVFFVSAAMTVLALVWFVRSTFHREAFLMEEGTDTVSGLCTPYRDKPFLWLLAASVLLGLAFEPVYSMLGNYLLDYYRLGTEFIGWQFALNAMLVVTLQIPFSHWGERWGARRQLLAGSLLLACGLGMLPLGTGVLFVCLSTVIWTLGEILFMPTLNVLVMQRAQAGKSGQYFGLFAMCWSTSVLLSPTLGGQLYGYFGGHSVWIASAALALLALPLIYQATRFIGASKGSSLSARRACFN
ncbi:Predicted arabinose efflux permease, MFS family [Pseudomonas frederiksbergensis]|uniref:Predicted arabinose efflux permease, MFS family n=1 Tax=Pseudomonas frederiksbergensis TaxID=104087 RepID=A0A1H4UHE9_9PSED|nr:MULTISPECIES: MFS transporter [Pseudomonas]PMU12158.1 MFS transporter [Pseudomonas sp. FW305-20]PMU15147.1 MFS transporter [Pseudomonas sp. FW305-122]PMU35232.1 MFS transporter [Pseudomonas sp. FW305-47B]PMX63736.1 MFS transporter [Pseudomonas sp. FW305-33]SEC68282.1 Predicted arabinose efflux permease, MFS family [Pseudomonas frederiksbergensis]